MGSALKLGTIFLVLLLCQCARHYGIYHEIQPGENLYRISIAYGTNYQELAEINNIEDPTGLGVGSEIFIPGAKQQRAVILADGSISKPKNKPYAKPKKAKRKKSKKGPPEIKTYRGKFIWPAKGVLSSRYGPRNGNMHDGIDIAARKGTPIYAAASGRVIYSDNRVRGYGKMIIIKHEGVYSTVYAHNSKNLVKRNEFVKRGQLIGKVGSTGRSTGPHLHFEIRKGRKATNPAFYLPKR